MPPQAVSCRQQAEAKFINFNVCVDPCFDGGSHPGMAISSTRTMHLDGRVEYRRTG